MGSVPVYSTSTTESTSRVKKFEGVVARPSRALILTEATPIALRPEEGQVMIGTQLLPASNIIEADGLDVDQDGFLGRFTVEGKRWTYVVVVFADRVEVQKFYADQSDPPIYGGDVSGFTRAGGCARFMVEELIPDCLEALGRPS